MKHHICSRNGAIVAAAILAVYVRSKCEDPFADGAIPAAKRDPSEHWPFMAGDVSFVRTMTEPLKGRSKATTQSGRDALKSHDIDRFVDRVDFGGADGHVAEASDLRDLEQIRVTRCSTTRSGVTAYFCEVGVATNWDAALGPEGKMGRFGTRSFGELLRCRHEEGERRGGRDHRRSVYRLGIGCEDSLAGYSHAWIIVAQPDGTFFWMQSFIQQYSLSTWLKKVDFTKDSGLAGHLSLAELLNKLNMIERLMKIDAWTEEANSDYLDLFNVDKNLEAARGSFGRPRKKWNTDHRLSVFSWDEACEYPLPEAGQKRVDAKEEGGPNGMPIDHCNATLAKSSLSDLLGVVAGPDFALEDIEAFLEEEAVNAD